MFFNHFLHKRKVHFRYLSTRKCTIYFWSFVTEPVFNRILRFPQIFFVSSHSGNSPFSESSRRYFIRMRKSSYSFIRTSLRHLRILEIRRRLWSLPLFLTQCRLIDKSLYLSPSNFQKLSVMSPRTTLSAGASLSLGPGLPLPVDTAPAQYIYV